MSLKRRFIMTVKFNVVQRANPQEREAPKKFYPSIVATSKLTKREAARTASQMSTTSMGDTSNVLENFLTIIPQELAKGNIVELGDFGSFWLRIESDGAELEDQVNAGSITNVLVQFKPGKEFKQALAAIQFEKA